MTAITLATAPSIPPSTPTLGAVRFHEEHQTVPPR